MSLPLNPEMLASAYEFLKTTPPFHRWKLPHHSDVTFRVIKDPSLRGWYDIRRGRHTIGISSNCIGYTYNLMATMAHEMIHLHQSTANMETRDVEHNAAFRMLAHRVCKYHGFDPKLF